MGTARLRGLGLFAAMMMAATVFANTAAAEEPPMPGVQLEDESSRCTAGFAAQGNDGSYYLLTSGHCDAHDGSVWTYGPSIPLGAITVSEKEGDKRDAAIIRLNPAVGVPTGGVGGLTIRDVLSSNQLKLGAPFCKLGAVTGETCGTITQIDGDVVEASVYSLGGDSGSPGYVKNDDGTVSAVGILMSSPDGDDNTTYFTLVQPLLGKWGIRILP